MSTIELMADIEFLKAQVARLEGELEKWKAAYQREVRAVEKVAREKAALAAVGQKLREELAEVGDDTNTIWDRDLLREWDAALSGEGKGIPYGEETRAPFGRDGNGQVVAGKRCHDCGVVVGKRHQGGCDVEECPTCHGQAITCDCAGEGKVWEQVEKALAGVLQEFNAKQRLSVALAAMKGE